MGDASHCLLIESIVCILLAILLFQAFFGSFFGEPKCGQNLVKSDSVTALTIIVYSSIGKDNFKDYSL